MDTAVEQNHSNCLSARTTRRNAAARKMTVASSVTTSDNCAGPSTPEGVAYRTQLAIGLHLRQRPLVRSVAAAGEGGHWARTQLDSKVFHYVPHPPLPWLNRSTAEQSSLCESSTTFVSGNGWLTFAAASSDLQTAFRLCRLCSDWKKAASVHRTSTGSACKRTGQLRRVYQSCMVHPAHVWMQSPLWMLF